jgi:hypothetical protein
VSQTNEVAVLSSTGHQAKICIGAESILTVLAFIFMPTEILSNWIQQHPDKIPSSQD